MKQFKKKRGKTFKMINYMRKNFKNRYTIKIM